MPARLSYRYWLWSPPCPFSSCSCGLGEAFGIPYGIPVRILIFPSWWVLHPGDGLVAKIPMSASTSSLVWDQFRLENAYKLMYLLPAVWPLDGISHRSNGIPGGQRSAWPPFFWAQRPLPSMHYCNMFGNCDPLSIAAFIKCASTDWNWITKMPLLFSKILSWGQLLKDSITWWKGITLL